MNVLDRPVRLPRPVFLVSWELAGLGAPPVVLEPDQNHRTDDGTTVFRHRALDELARLGLTDPDGGLVPRYRATLRVLATARREVYLWSNLRRASVRAAAMLTAESGRDAVRLITDHQVVQLDPIRPRDLVESLVGTLPDARVARIRPLCVPKAQYEDAGRDYGGDDPFTEASAQADELRRLMRADRDAMHQLYAATRDSAGERTRSTPLSAIDLTREGRVLSFVSDGPDGDPQINLYPGDRAHVADALALTLGGLE
ncbi:ESAT-6 protein secretion system EspG family protein [Amycolatopsis sulphurea]|uniref:ESAT-6 protein secretion system EspG family protein n=1 Tax=Amycolatopsis sulphurea TaxID=76022 RepID=A0A2A9F6Q2_9PSEU|nr:ESX secretion-associated protein EspG [Amycolatopsis sulphurea]PFG47097.1 ESAT-6 protein secretion system EspG family protein [Amycolatopsis sulphurea]